MKNDISTSINSQRISLKDFLVFISNFTYVKKLHYEHTKDKKYTPRYKEGQIAAHNYFQELVYYYYKKDDALKKELVVQLHVQLDDLELLKESDYKQGMVDAFNTLLNEMMNEHNMITTKSHHE